MKFLLLLTTVVLTTYNLFSQTGPGGVGTKDGTSNLILWLDANQITDVTHGNNISTWRDASGYGHDASQTVSLSKPNWFADSVNTFPFVRFDDSGEFLDGVLTTGLNALASMITVCFFDSLNQAGDNDWVASVGSTNMVNTSMNIARRRSDGGNSDRYFNWDGTQNNFGPVITGRQWTILSQFQHSTAPYHNVYQDGGTAVADDFTTGALNTNTDFAIGDWTDTPGGTDKMVGKIPEVILFDKELNTAEIYIVHSYLGAKYDIANSNDQYNGDNGVNGDNDRDVIGIGTESDGSNDEAHGAGLHILQDGGFDNGDYVMAGHAVQVNSINTSDVAVGYDARWDRAYWMDITDAGGAINVDITFDYSEAGVGSNPDPTVVSNYVLVYRATGAGAWTTITAASSVIANRVVFNDVALSSDGFYTLATLDNTTSPLGNDPTSSSCKGPGGVEDIDGASDLKLWLDPFAMRPTEGDQIAIFTDMSDYDNSADVLHAPNPATFSTGVVNNMPVARFEGNNYMQGELDAALTAENTVISVGYFNNSQGAGDNDYLISIGNPTTNMRHASIGRRRSDVAADHNKYYSWDGDGTFFGPVISTEPPGMFSIRKTRLREVFIIYILMDPV